MWGGSLAIWIITTAASKSHLTESQFNSLRLDHPRYRATEEKMMQLMLPSTGLFRANGNAWMPVPLPGRPGANGTHARTLHSFHPQTPIEQAWNYLVRFTKMIYNTVHPCMSVVCSMRSRKIKIFTENSRFFAKFTQYRSLGHVTSGGKYHKSCIKYLREMRATAFPPKCSTPIFIISFLLWHIWRKSIYIVFHQTLILMPHQHILSK